MLPIPGTYFRLGKVRVTVPRIEEAFYSNLLPSTALDPKSHIAGLLIFAKLLINKALFMEIISWLILWLVIELSWL